jgi:uncharacterized membrane protein YraQ (UPF0718 family)
MPQLTNAFTLFMSLLVEAFPFLLLGVLLSSGLLVLVQENRIIQYLPQNPLLGAFTGSLFGFLFPACECGNVPVARRLLLQGSPSAVAFGFLLAAPTINPIVIWSTWTAFRDQPEIVVLRIVISLAIATLVGYLLGTPTNLRSLLQPAVANALPQQPSDPPPLLQKGTFMLGNTPQRFEQFASQQALNAESVPRSFTGRWNLFLDNTLQELRDLGAVLVLGSAMAALIQVFVPRDWVLSLGNNALTSILTMMLLAGMVSICSTVDSFFALAFAGSFSSGAILAFLVYGPMIDIKSIGMFLSVFKARTIFWMFVLVSQCTFLASVWINFHWS